MLVALDAVAADGFILNDIDSYVIGLHRMLCSYVGREQDFYTEFYRIVDHYGLTLSFRENIVTDHGFVYGGYQDVKAIRETIPANYLQFFDGDYSYLLLFFD